MFTGIITGRGTVRKTIGNQGGDDHNGILRIVIGCPYDPASIAIGASIACSGTCLTVVDRGKDADGPWFAVDVSDETIARTVSAHWDTGAELNLEPAMKMGDELGGHIVTGHVDGIGTVTGLETINDSKQVTILAPAALAPAIATKGSVAIDGVSLTVNDVHDSDDGQCRFMLNVIPHTAAETTLGNLKLGDTVNIEIDILARYLQRMIALRGQSI